MRRRVAVSVVTCAVVVATAGYHAAGGAATGHRRFVAEVTNPWFPLTPGTRWEYRGVSDGQPARNMVFVARRVERVAGVRCTVVIDRAYEGGRLVERTEDWYAQDRGGTVWYFGEDTAELDARGRVVSREGSWRAGRDGARPGVYMPAVPTVGQEFQQEHLAGEAEDHFRVLRRDVRITVPAGTYRKALLTLEWNPLEPGLREHKWYVPGVGQVAERVVHGGSDRAVLHSVARP